MWWYVVYVIVLLVIYKWIQSKQLARKLPPTRPGWPIVGSGLEINAQRFHLQLVEWKKQYGDIFTVWSFGMPFVVPGTFELTEEMHHMCDNRSSQIVYKLTSSGGKDLINGDIKDPEFSNLRKITFKALKSFGVLLKDLEVLLQSEIEEFVDLLKDSNQKPLDPDKMIRTTLCCIISSLMFGEKLGRDHSDIKTMLELVDEFNEMINFGFGMELDFFPWLKNFNTPTMKKINTFNKKRDALFDGYLKCFRDNLDTGNQAGLVHLLMKHSSLDTEEEQDPAAEQLNDVQIKATFMDFLIGGIETTRSTTLGLLLHLLHNPGQQQILHREADDVIGRSRSPTLNDQSKMPRLKAALLESLRFVPPVPLLVRCSHKEIQFGGYTIPENTQLIASFWGLCHDPDFWEEPGKWKPERFLDDQGQLLPSSHPKRRRTTFAFGEGKRGCPGKSFAEARLTMLFATLLQRFDLRPDPDNPPPYLVPKDIIKNAISIIPKFTMQFVPRK